MNEYSTLKMNWVTYVLVPKKEFDSSKKIQTRERLEPKESFPKTYIETDEEGTWETIDFWPEWIMAKDLYLLHKQIEDDRSI